MTEEIRTLVRKVISEAKKKKVKDVELEEDVDPAGYSFSKAFDFSIPLGDSNLYKRQGAVNYGPMTGDSGISLDDHVRAKTMFPESMVRAIVGMIIQEELANDSSWDMLSEAMDPSSMRPDNIWSEALHWYDYHKRGLGEKKMGFKKLQGQLAHKKGIKDPAALAASIGRKKYGKKAFQAKSAAGRK